MSEEKKAVVPPGLNLGDWRQGDGIATAIQNSHQMLTSSTGLEKTTRGAVRRDRSMRELLSGDRKPPGWP